MTLRSQLTLQPITALISCLSIPLCILHAQTQTPPAATTPIQHVVVIFQENVSFDHYFATYPVAANTPGEPQFSAAASTPSVNGLSGPLLGASNPNSVAPFRLARSQAQTCDQ